MKREDLNRMMSYRSGLAYALEIMECRGFADGIGELKDEILYMDAEISERTESHEGVAENFDTD